MYGSDAWRRFCRSNRLEPRMSLKGNCWDNAAAEAFFGRDASESSWMGSPEWWSGVPHSFRRRSQPLSHWPRAAGR